MKILFVVVSIFLLIGGLLGLTDETHSSAPIVMVALGMAGIGFAAYQRRA